MLFPFLNSINPLLFQASMLNLWDQTNTYLSMPNARRERRRADEAGNANTTQHPASAPGRLLGEIFNFGRSIRPAATRAQTNRKRNSWGPTRNPACQRNPLPQNNCTHDGKFVTSGTLTRTEGPSCGAKPRNFAAKRSSTSEACTGPEFVCWAINLIAQF